MQTHIQPSIVYAITSLHYLYIFVWNCTIQILCHGTLIGRLIQCPIGSQLNSQLTGPPSIFKQTPCMPPRNNNMWIYWAITYTPYNRLCLPTFYVKNINELMYSLECRKWHNLKAKGVYNHVEVSWSNLNEGLRQTSSVRQLYNLCIWIKRKTLSPPSRSPLLVWLVSVALPCTRHLHARSGTNG